MLGFGEWMEGKFQSGYETLIGKQLVRELGGDPETTLNFSSLLEKGGEALGADELYGAIERALDVAEKNGARREAIVRNRLGLVRMKGHGLELLKFANNLMLAALNDIEKQDREMNRADWERQRRRRA